MDSGIWHHTTAEVGLAAVLDRLPTRISAGDVTLRLHAAGDDAGTSGARARVVPVRWSTGRRGHGRRAGGGHLEVAPLASGDTGLRLCLDAPAGARLDAPLGARLDATAPRLLRGLRDHLAAPTAAGPRPVDPAVGRRRVLAATALLGLPAVVLALATLTSSPTPVSVDDRVATFRADTAADPVASPTDAPPEEEGSGSASVDEAPDAEEGDGPTAPPDVEDRGPDPAAGPDGAAGADVAAERGEAAPAETPRGSGDRDEEPAEPRVRRPEPGVYQYATTGGDRVSMRGSARDYPETTSVTVRHDDCGFTQRWDVFDERWEERRWCVEDEGRELMAMSSYREFFGHGQQNDLTCQGSTPPADAIEPGTRWTMVCDDEDTRATSRVEVAGPTEIDVGGERVETMHLRLETRVEGDTTGRMEGEQWVVPDTGLLVREQWETEVETAGPMGPVTYTEDYTLLLESMEPSR